jgi:hypothetical protein
MGLIVTAIAWLVIVASAVLSLVSAVALLMLVAGSHGTASGTLFGFVSVVVLPPVSLVAGIGFLRRRAWAHYFLVALFGVMLAVASSDYWRANPEPYRYVSPSGVPTTVLATDRTLFVPAIAVALGMLAVLLSRRVRLEFAGTPSAAAPTRAKTTVPHGARDWRVGHVGRDRMYYEERHDGAWRRIDIDGEMLTGRAHHAVYLASPEGWLDYPEWASHRRDEIVARIRSEFGEPDYEYSHAGVPSAPPIGWVQPRPGSRLAALAAVAILLAIAAGMSWLVYEGVGTGTTILPSKSALQRRPVSRTDEPILFWVAIASYASVAGGCVGLVGWGVAQVRRTAPL